MAIEVEDGTGKSNAVSYLSVADADAYHESRGNEAWADEDDAVKETALVRATFGIDQWLRGRWNGTKKTSTQSLAWPRTDVVDEEGYDVADDEVPAVLEYAVAEVALLELTTRFIQQSVGSSNAVSSETVGPISVSYRADAPSITYYPHIEAMLNGIASVGGIQLGMTISLTEAEIEAQSGSNDMFDYDEYFNLIKWP